MRFVIKDKTVWHDWFAWHPVHEKGVVYWFETVQRRKRIGMWTNWFEYKPKE